MTNYTQLIEISSDQENAVERAIHEFKKYADEGKRFGVEIDIERVELKEGQTVEGFE